MTKLAPSPELPTSDVPLYVCTPRASSSALSKPIVWPETLPWLQFSESILPTLMAGLKLQPSRERRPMITERANDDAPEDVGSTVLEKFIRRTMELIIGSENLTYMLIANKSVDQIAARLHQSFPDASTGGNLRRATLLVGGQETEAQKEALKIMIFLASNHFIMDPTRTKDCVHWGGKYIEDARVFMDLFRLAGLTNLRILTDIIYLSQTSPTITGLVDLLFRASVTTESTDVILKLLSLDRRININRPICYLWWSHDSGSAWSPLEYFILKGSIGSTASILDAGADPNRRTSGYSPLTLAATVVPYHASARMIRLLLEAGAAVNQDKESTALWLAIKRNNLEVIDILLEAGANMATSSSFPRELEPYAHLIHVHTDNQDAMFELYSQSEFVTCLDIAASFSQKSFSEWDDMLYLSTEYPYDDDEVVALNLVSHILDRAGPELDRDNSLKSRAIKFAAFRGYDKVMSLLYEIGGDVKFTDGFLPALYAAVNWAHIESCELLLKLGSSIKPQLCQRHSGLRKKETIQAGYLSPLHVAVAYDSCPLTYLLVQHGADINFLREVYRPTRKTGYGFRDQVRQFREYAQTGKCLGSLTPLGMAMEIGSWDVALLLVDLGATVQSEYLVRAASAGQNQLVCRLCIRLAGHADFSKHGSDALEASIIHGHGLATLALMNAGLGKAMGVSAWIFRLPDPSAIQRMLHSSIPQNLWRNRSPDGRTFLENSILSGNLDVFRFALSLDPSSYDSGALCAAVSWASRSPIPSIDVELEEILRRRSKIIADDPLFDPVLEATAATISAYSRRLDVTSKLMRIDKTAVNLSVLPGYSVWNWLDANPLATTRDGSDICGYARITCRFSYDRIVKWNDWHAADRQTVTPIFTAIKSRFEPGVHALLDLGYRADALSLMAAMEEDLSITLQWRLVQECNDISAQNFTHPWNFYTPLRGALDRCDERLVMLLLDSGADPNVGFPLDIIPGDFTYPGYATETTCGLAIKMRNLDLVDILLDKGVSVDDGIKLRFRVNTPLQVAAAIGHLGMIQLLLDHGADRNARRALMNGYTALEAAALYGRLDAVQLLLQAGVNTKNSGQLQFVRALNLAQQSGHLGVEKVIRAHRFWTAHDQILLEELEEASKKLGFFVLVHPIEYTEEEITALQNETFESGMLYDFELWGPESRSAKYAKTQELTTKAEMNCEARSSSELVTCDPKEDLGIGQHLGTSFGSPRPRDEPIDSVQGIISELTWEEESRKQELLDDMYGVKEAPYRPTEWKW